MTYAYPLYQVTGCECGGDEYVSAVWVERSNTGEWHLVIEVRCHHCDKLTVADHPWSEMIERAAAEEAEVDDADDLRDRIADLEQEIEDSETSSDIEAYQELIRRQDELDELYDDLNEIERRKRQNRPGED